MRYEWGFVNKEYLSIPELFHSKEKVAVLMLTLC